MEPLHTVHRATKLEMHAVYDDRFFKHATPVLGTQKQGPRIEPPHVSFKLFRFPPPFTSAVRPVTLTGT